MIVWGGEGQTGASSNSGGRYEPGDQHLDVDDDRTAHPAGLSLGRLDRAPR